MPLRPILFFCVVATELAVLSVLGTQVIGNFTAMSVNVLDSNSLLFAQGRSSYSHFYELKPNEIYRITSESCCPRLEWLEGEVVNTVNEDGLHERFDYSVGKPAGVFRIVSLGDSFTYGSNVNTEDNYSEVLEDILNERLACSPDMKFEVLNLGVPGYDIAYAAERFRMRGEKYEPDLVLWSLKSGDFVNLITELQREQMVSGGENLKDPVLLSLGAVREARELIQLRGTEWMRAYVREVFETFTERHRKSVVLFSSSNWQWDRTSLLLVEEIVRSGSGWHFFRMSSDLSGSMLPDHHPDETGHRIIAEDLFAYLVGKDLIPCVEQE